MREQTVKALDGAGEPTVLPLKVAAPRTIRHLHRHPPVRLTQDNEGLRVVRYQTLYLT
jgi:hypothetical protein